MITEFISNYTELGWKRKAILACIQLAEEENLIDSKEEELLQEYVKKYIPKDNFEREY